MSLIDAFPVSQKEAGIMLILFPMLMVVLFLQQMKNENEGEEEKKSIPGTRIGRYVYDLRERDKRYVGALSSTRVTRLQLV